MNKNSLKTAVLSILYLLLAAIIILVVNQLLFLFLDEIAFKFFIWFNSLHWLIKVAALFLGGPVLILTTLQIIGGIVSFLGGMIFNKLPSNVFTFISTAILATSNAIWLIIRLWQIPERYDFWIILELIILSVFIWQLSSVVIPARNQIKN